MSATVCSRSTCSAASTLAAVRMRFRRRSRSAAPRIVRLSRIRFRGRPRQPGNRPRLRVWRRSLRATSAGSGRARDESSRRFESQAALPAGVGRRPLSRLLLSAVVRARGEPRAFHGRRRDAERDRDRLAGAGIHIRRTPAANLVCSLNRIGAFSICTEQSVHRNFGYWVETTNGRRWASCGWRPSDSDWNLESAPIEVSGRFVAVDDTLPLVRGEAAFRFVMHRLFRWAAIAEFFHRRLKGWKSTAAATVRSVSRGRFLAG